MIALVVLSTMLLPQSRHENLVASQETLLSLVTQQVAPYGYADLCFGGDHTYLRFDSSFATRGLATFRVEKPDVIRQIVQSGASSVPFLLAHLDDMRQTPINLHRQERIDDYYDLNTPDRWFFNPHLSDPGVIPLQHHLTVGDLSYFLLGQIVNRNFDPLLPLFPHVRYPVFNGPSATPSLAANAKAEWNGLTASKLKASLIRDVTHPLVAWRDVGGIRRLMAFFPGRYLNDLAIRRLRTPMKELDLDTEAAPYAIRVRRHEILTNPDYISPYQYGMFVLAISDLKSRRIDAILREELRNFARRKSISADDDKMAILVVGRLASSGRTIDLSICKWFCRERVKTSKLPYLFREALNALGR